MKAFIIDRYGSGARMRASEMPDPVMREDEVLVRAKAKRYRVNCSLLFMRANGDRLSEITALIDAGIIRPVVDRVFPFESTDEALAYVEAGRARGKVVVQVRPPEARRAL